MNPPRQQVGSIPGLAKQMTPPGLVPGNPDNLPFPNAASMANSDMGQRPMASYYRDTLVVPRPMSFGITSQPDNEMGRLRGKTLGFPEDDWMPTQLSMGGGPLNYGLAEAGSRLVNRDAARPQPGRGGVTTSLGATSSRMRGRG